MENIIQIENIPNSSYPFCLHLLLKAEPRSSKSILLRILRLLSIGDLNMLGMMAHYWISMSGIKYAGSSTSALEGSVANAPGYLLKNYASGLRGEDD